MVIIKESPEVVQKYLDECESFIEVLSRLNLKTRGYYYKILYEYIKEHNLSTDILKLNRIRASTRHFLRVGLNIKIKHEDLFVDNCKHARHIVKKYLIVNNLIPYTCRKCGNNGEWMGEKLILQLEHINGKNNDNRLENLCYLCANCHSQTNTYCGRACRKNKCADCGTYIKTSSIRCQKCNGTFHKNINKSRPATKSKVLVKNKKVTIKKERPKKFVISKDELELLIKTKTYTEIGKMFGVSDNAIKKRCKKLGIIIENRLGYWAKVKYGKIL